VADEDVDSRELVALQVSRHLPGRRLLLSRGGTHLLDLVTEERPDTVVLSLGVPPYPTLRILHQIRCAAPVAHIVAMSNLVSRSDEQGALVAGANRYLTKGSPVAKLLHSLQRDPQAFVYEANEKP
jgi:DNA-binding NarL/FixJ family response regulator